MNNKKYQVSLVVLFAMIFTLLLFYQNCSKGSSGSLGGSSSIVNPTGGAGVCPSGTNVGTNGLCYYYNPATRTLKIYGGGAALHGCADITGTSCYANTVDLPGADGSPTACSRSGGWATFQGCNAANEQEDGIGTWTFTNLGCDGPNDYSTVYNTVYFQFKVGFGDASLLPNVQVVYGPAQKLKDRLVINYG